ncbi:hypothetical protein Ahy_B02g060336 [Arachis hypogaea]|uniref:Rhodanese domain-containing protein n=1 Tax=Arachis hypogaea TaxID=3818 RepID=A0A445AIF1_ARAHY|nr:hypothetical protein Ahy_B02g060336 [Arachis hypogaea]
MGYFKVKVYHGGWFTYKNGPLEYVGGKTIVIEEIDGDRWSVFEAYVELKQFGYVEENIPSLWFKDPTHEDLEKNLKLFKTDVDSIEMCKIPELRDYVELYVVHKVEEEEVFPAAGYIDVGEKDGMGDISSEGQELVLYGGLDEGQNQSGPGGSDSGLEDDNEVEYGNSSDSDSLDSEYKPSGKEDDSKDDLHFTDSDDELDPDVSGFQDVNVMSKKRRDVKKNAVGNEDFENDEGGNSDDLDLDHEVGAEGSDSEHQGVRFPVHKAQKDMNQYKWKVGIVYASREEFKDTVTAYAVHTARAIKFRKCDLKRVRAVCSTDCPFWLYASKIGDEDTWQLRSMNLTHTCTKAHRVGILHSKWLGKAFKKKVEANPKVKIRELVSKAQKKPSHKLVKKRRAAAGDEEHSSRTHLSRKGEKQRCSIGRSVGHNKSRCPKPIKDLPIPKLSIKRKAGSTTQPPSSAQSNNAAQPKRPRGRPKVLGSTQHDLQPNKVASPTSLAPPSSSSQPTTRNLPSAQPPLGTSSSQPVGHFSARLSGAPHIFPKKLKLMAKLPPRKWGLL